MFLSVNHIKALLFNINKFQSAIYNEKNIFLQKIISKICNKNNERLLNDLCLQNKTVNKNIKYFLISEILYNDKYKNLFFIENEYPYFKLNEKQIKENIILKTKNIISMLLYNCRDLNEYDFEEEFYDDTINIFKKLKIFVKSTDFVVNDKIPSDWNIEILFEYFKKLPNEYKKNDFQKLYDELKNDIETTIKRYDFNGLSLIIDKIKFSKKIKDYYKNKKDILDDININNEVNKIINNEEINVKLFFIYKEDKKVLNIYKEDINMVNGKFNFCSAFLKYMGYIIFLVQFVNNLLFHFLGRFIFIDNNPRPKTCKTIKEFTEEFPNINTLTIHNKLNVFDITKELKVPENLDKFIKIIKNFLKNKKKIKDKNLLNVIYDKIYDYIMSKIYYKIYPNEPDNSDLDLYKKFQVYSSWIKLSNLIKDNTNYNIELILPDIKKNFNLIDIEKTPRKKIINMNHIFYLINKLLIFNQDETLIGTDNQMPLLNYVFIKSKQKRIFTNCEFMKLYMGENIKKKEGNNLAQLESIKDYTKNLTFKNLFNITEKEFEENNNKYKNIIE